ncbi:hypothetical protein [Streptococcus dysgalactiae]
MTISLKILSISFFRIVYILSLIAVAEISFDESILSIQELIYQVKEEKFQADLTKQLT